MAYSAWHYQGSAFRMGATFGPSGEAEQVLVSSTARTTALLGRCAQLPLMALNLTSAPSVRCFPRAIARPAQSGFRFCPARPKAQLGGLSPNRHVASRRLWARAPGPGHAPHGD
ncbi:hypothetical protein NDU88_002150 [Pleurodeles waltl]|uniref:Uncharacterized protein n=1 Tax=Pleurodeles waltl TaxID=8319 RepID=A0AAV7UCD5_PLEWA|nr:hypothetical protein NDU88_002150 [Pleurodeles waltl]